MNEITEVSIVTRDADEFDAANEHWMWFGSLDSDENRLQELRSCCQDHCLEVELGTDGVDIWCSPQESAGDLGRRYLSIAYGMFAMLQYQLDKENQNERTNPTT